MDRIVQFQIIPESEFDHFGIRVLTESGRILRSANPRDSDGNRVGFSEWYADALPPIPQPKAPPEVAQCEP